MKKYLLLLFITLIIGSLSSHAQFTKYIVRLKDKGTNPFTLANPSQYLTARSIARRTRYGIVIDSTDLPITPRYIDSIRLSGTVIILNSSKWLNQVAIQTSDAAALTKINGFPFVLSVGPIAAFAGGPADQLVNKKMDVATNQLITTPATPQNATDYYSYGQSYGQVHITQGEFLHNHGFRGQGMQMAILDAGFFHYLSLPTFDSLRNNGQVLGTWDFVAGDASVDEDNSHGMNCLSTITANMPGTFMGQAPKVSVYLYRTEDVNSEYPIEEQNWAAGIERADSLGIDVSSTSLGYNQFDNAIFNHTYADMDGNTTMIAKAADYAAKKGILVLEAAGNEGTNAWHYIITPADSDSTIAVGAVSTAGVIGSFSSWGPSSDGQIKPSIDNVGVNATIASPANGQPTFGSGTSFACPNMAGISTCLWQAFPEVNNMTIINTMQQSANRYTIPDNHYGYGVPDMKKSFVMLVKQLYTQSVSTSSCNSILQWNVKTDTTINVFVERKLPAGNYTVINQQGLSGAFALRPFTYTDDLTGVPTGIVWYRFRMAIGVDTTFYLDSMSVNHSINCVAAATLNTSSLSTFGSVCVGITSNAGSFTVTGANLPAGNVAIGPLAGYSFSTTAAGTYTASLTLAQPGGSYSQTIYVKFTPTVVISYNGNIPVTIGATTTSVAATGLGINTAASMLTGAVITNTITMHGAQLPGSIVSIGCSPVTVYGMEYSTINGFANGSGTQVAATGNVAGAYSVTLSTLLPGTTYYYKAYGANAAGTAYGNQLSFTTLPLPDGLIVYSSPVDHSGSFHYSLTGATAGHYVIQIFNSGGQMVVKKEMDITLNYIDDTFTLPAYLGGGVYVLQVSNPAAGSKKRKSFMVR